uniref:Triple QxxK/R motif-containing protein n=1 Tax=Gallus gallus TaxID=9031 RepID=A0A8V0Y2W3_CHICK
MGRKDASTARTPVDQYRKQIGKQDYKKTRPMLRATRLKAEAKKTAIGVKLKCLRFAILPLRKEGRMEKKERKKDREKGRKNGREEEKRLFKMTSSDCNVSCTPGP